MKINEARNGRHRGLDNKDSAFKGTEIRLRSWSTRPAALLLRQGDATLLIRGHARSSQAQNNDAAVFEKVVRVSAWLCGPLDQRLPWRPQSP